MLEKAKLLVIRLDTVFQVFPYTISKIELRMRNILINNKPLLDGIAHFLQFLHVNKQF